MPPELAKLNFVFARPGGTALEFEAACEELRCAVDSDHRYIVLHTKMTAWANEWDEAGREEAYLIRGAFLDVLREFVRAQDRVRSPSCWSSHHTHYRASCAK